MVAAWAREGLAARGVLLDEVSSGQLCAARRWEHRVSSEGASLELQLADGRLVRGGDVRSVLNRLTAVPVDWLREVATQDRDYAYAEFTALLCSAFHALSCPVLNRPSPAGLGGRWRDDVEWAVLAGRAGLTVPELGVSSDRYAAAEAAPGEGWHVFAVEGRVVAPTSLPAPAAEACARLAHAAGDALLGIELVPADVATGAAFRRATALPDFRSGGDPLLDALAGALGR